ncbi:MAG: glycosyltransferase family 39 protein [Phycisphaerales bacterium]|nr:glycosyltransferase family 39 protein [Phycisphaerales bacterium]
MPAFMAILLLAGVVFIPLWGGPALGDHEAIVAQCARDMRLTGDWLVPHFLDTDFLRKPPLPVWLVAAASYVWPSDVAIGLPVTTSCSRLPSALAALGTVLLIWRLAASMYGTACGRTAAVVAVSSVFIMLYAPNATAEMLLTFTCTWAYAHFWYALKASRSSRRFVHVMLFYLAWGAAMMAKGPAPIALVAIPLTAYWFMHGPLRVWMRGGLRRGGLAGVCFLRSLVPRLKEVATRWWIVPGVLVFAAVFVPWMAAVARRDPSAWNLWNWQFLQRAVGDFEDTRVRGPLYYVPLAAGLLGVWLLFLPEALASGWLAGYRRFTRAMLYCGFWGVGGVAVMSAMEFKKPYYILPAMPGLVLLVAPVVQRRLEQERLGRPGRWTLLLASAAACVMVYVFANRWMATHVPEAAGGLRWLVILGATGGVAGVALYAWNHRRAALSVLAGGSVACFLITWLGFASLIGDMGKVSRLEATLTAAGVPRDARILWADQRPDARLSFYFNRRSEHMIHPSEIVDRMVDRTGMKTELARMASQRAADLLRSRESVYLILDRHRCEAGIAELPPCKALPDVANRPSLEPPQWIVLSNAR